MLAWPSIRATTSLRAMPFLPGWEAQTPTHYIGAASEIVHAIREEVGYDVDLGVELHRNFGPDESVILAREIAPLRILYYEDPVAPESLSALKYVADRVDIPIAAGERCYSLFQFKDLLDTVPVAMIRPDLSLAGGFTQCRKIAALAEASFVNVFPHLMGSAVNLAAFVQFGAAIPNYALMEGQATVLNDIVDIPLTVENGYVDRSRSTGHRHRAPGGGACKLSLPPPLLALRPPGRRLRRPLRAKSIVMAVRSRKCLERRPP